MLSLNIYNNICEQPEDSAIFLLLCFMKKKKKLGFAMFDMSVNKNFPRISIFGWTAPLG